MFGDEQRQQQGAAGQVEAKLEQRHPPRRPLHTAGHQVGHDTAAEIGAIDDQHRLLETEQPAAQEADAEQRHGDGGLAGRRQCGANQEGRRQRAVEAGHQRHHTVGLGERHRAGLQQYQPVIEQAQAEDGAQRRLPVLQPPLRHQDAGQSQRQHDDDADIQRNQKQDERATDIAAYQDRQRAARLDHPRRQQTDQDEGDDGGALDHRPQHRAPEQAKQGEGGNARQDELHAASDHVAKVGGQQLFADKEQPQASQNAGKSERHGQPALPTCPVRISGG